MDRTRLLRTLVVADIFLAFGSVGAQALFGWTLPPELQAFTHDRFDRMPGLSDVVPIVLLWTSSVCALVAWFGLLTFWRHARGVYLVSMSAYLLHILVAGASVKPSVAALFTTGNAVIGGMILGLVYFSDLARRFEREPIEREASTFHPA